MALFFGKVLNECFRILYAGLKLRTRALWVQSILYHEGEKESFNAN